MLRVMNALLGLPRWAGAMVRTTSGKRSGVYQGAIRHHPNRERLYLSIPCRSASSSCRTSGAWRSRWRFKRQDGRKTNGGLVPGSGRCVQPDGRVVASNADCGAHRPRSVRGAGAEQGLDRQTDIHREPQQPRSEARIAAVSDSATPWAKGLQKRSTPSPVAPNTRREVGPPTPDQIDFVIGQLTGGIGRAVGKVAATATAPFTERLPLPRSLNWSAVVRRHRWPLGQSDKFYENITKANEVENEIKGRVRDGISVSDYLADHPGAITRSTRKRWQRQVAALRKARHAVTMKGRADEVSKGAGDQRADCQRYAQFQQGRRT